MNEFVVFYAWQSDRVERMNRHLIRFALNLAAKKISQDPQIGISVRIDSDTEGVLGHIPVTDTILKKIVACDAFVPDLTFVAQTDGGKLVCNPNVMLEYGYALRAKSHAVMMPVMNIAYGPAENLPFDMGHLRHPIKYKLAATAKDAERRAARKELADEFERILRLLIAAWSPSSADRKPFLEQPSMGSPAFFFPSGASIAAFGHPGEQEYRFDGDRAIYLRLFPKFGDGQPLVGRAAIKALVRDRGVLNSMAVTGHGLSSRNDYGYVVIDPTSNYTTRGIAQAFQTGELWGVNSQVFQAAPVQLFGVPQEMGIACGVFAVERLYARTLENFMSVATSQMKLIPPFIVEIGAVGLKGVYLGGPHPQFSQGQLYGPIRDNELIRRYEVQRTSREALFDVLRKFFNELYDLAECSRPELVTDQHVKLYELPERS